MPFKCPIKAKESSKRYRQTSNGKKSAKITKWKSYGIIDDDFNSLHEYYIN